MAEFCHNGKGRSDVAACACLLYTSMQGALGVNTFAYAPFAFLNWICPLISLFYGFTGISIEKMTEEEYEEAMARREEEQKRAAEAIEA